MPLQYRSGEAIEPGDYVLWHGEPGKVELVADPAAEPDSWYVTEHGGGVMVNPPMALEHSVEDLDFVGRKLSGSAVGFGRMTIGDYDEVLQVLAATPGVVLRAADSRDTTARYLDRNAGLSFVARLDRQIVACIMSGHDGRRGYLQHLAVLPESRRQGIGSLLVVHCLVALGRLGIEKIHLDVLADHQLAHQFWTSAGWQRRDDIVRYSFTNSSDPNA